MKKYLLSFLVFISTYIFAFFIESIIISFSTNNTIIRSFTNIISNQPLVFFINFFVGLFLLIAGFLFLSFLELRKAKDAYNNARNRFGFIKNNQVVCFEGVIEPNERAEHLLSPISRQKCVLYCYGNKWIGGGAAQVRTVIKPSGETISLNGWLSGEYVEKKEYNPKENNLDHLFSFMMKRKDPSVTEQKVARAPFFYKLDSKTNQRDSFTNDEILNSLSKKTFRQNKYTEIVIPSGIYGWALGKWDNKNKQLIPMRFSAYIYIIQKDYKETFLNYISKYRRNYLLGVLSLVILAAALSLPIILPSIL